MIWHCVPWTFRWSSKARGYYSSGKCTHLQNWPLPKQVILTQGNTNVWTMRAVQSPPAIVRRDTQKNVQLTTDLTIRWIVDWLSAASTASQFVSSLPKINISPCATFFSEICCPEVLRYMHCYLFSFLTCCYAVKSIKIGYLHHLLQ